MPDVTGRKPDGRSIETRAGDVYSAKDVEDTIIALTEHVAGLGYAFAQVTPRGDRNFENRTISVVYAIDQGPRPMSSASKSAATTARATMSSAANSTSAKATPSTRC